MFFSSWIFVRWCRTYLLARGKTVDHSPSGSVPVTINSEVVKSVQRLEAVYVKLWLTSRQVVKEALAKFSSNLLEAATYIQGRIESLMRSSAGSSCVAEVCLTSSEELDMHLDCINATGKIVDPKDIQAVYGSVSI